MVKRPANENELLAQNRKARFNFHIGETLEAGMELRGTEVKAIRAREFSLDESFAVITKGQVYLHGMHIQPYRFGNQFNHAPDRIRRLLLHREEIRRLEAATGKEGQTLVPLDVHLKRGRIKITLGLAKGKALHDKRDTLRKKESQREADRAIAQARRR
jgi:SsrA-binding protein